MYFFNKKTPKNEKGNRAHINSKTVNELIQKYCDKNSCQLTTTDSRKLLKLNPKLFFRINNLFERRIGPNYRIPNLNDHSLFGYTVIYLHSNSFILGAAFLSGNQLNSLAAAENEFGGIGTLLYIKSCMHLNQQLFSSVSLKSCRYTTLFYDSMGAKRPYDTCGKTLFYEGETDNFPHFANRLKRYISPEQTIENQDKDKPPHEDKRGICESEEDNDEWMFAGSNPAYF